MPFESPWGQWNYHKLSWVVFQWHPRLCSQFLRFLSEKRTQLNKDVSSNAFPVFSFLSHPCTLCFELFSRSSSCGIMAEKEVSLAISECIPKCQLPPNPNLPERCPRGTAARRDGTLHLMNSSISESIFHFHLWFANFGLETLSMPNESNRVLQCLSIIRFLK